MHFRDDISEIPNYMMNSISLYMVYIPYYTISTISLHIPYDNTKIIRTMFLRTFVLNPLRAQWSWLLLIEPV